MVFALEGTHFLRYIKSTTLAYLAPTAASQLGLAFGNHRIISAYRKHKNLQSILIISDDRPTPHLQHSHKNRKYTNTIYLVILTITVTPKPFRVKTMHCSSLIENAKETCVHTAASQSTVKLWVCIYLKVSIKNVSRILVLCLWCYGPPTVGLYGI